MAYAIQSIFISICEIPRRHRMYHRREPSTSLRTFCSFDKGVIWYLYGKLRNFLYRRDIFTMLYTVIAAFSLPISPACTFRPTVVSLIAVYLCSKDWDEAAARTANSWSWDSPAFLVLSFGPSNYKKLKIIKNHSREADIITKRSSIPNIASYKRL